MTKIGETFLIVSPTKLFGACPLAPPPGFGAYVGCIKHKLI